MGDDGGLVKGTVESFTGVLVTSHISKWSMQSAVTVAEHATSLLKSYVNDPLAVAANAPHVQAPTKTITTMAIQTFTLLRISALLDEFLHVLQLVLADVAGLHVPWVL